MSVFGFRRAFDTRVWQEGFTVVLLRPPVFERGFACFFLLVRVELLWTEVDKLEAGGEEDEDGRGEYEVGRGDDAVGGEEEGQGYKS